MTDSTDDPIDQAPGSEPTTDEEVFMRLAGAMIHIDQALTDIRAALETALQKLVAIHATSKRQEHLLTDITRTLREGVDGSQDSQGGF
jgi:hypothetical protein